MASVSKRYPDVPQYLLRAPVLLHRSKAGGVKKHSAIGNEKQGLMHKETCSHRKGEHSATIALSAIVLGTICFSFALQRAKAIIELKCKWTAGLTSQLDIRSNRQAASTWELPPVQLV